MLNFLVDKQMNIMLHLQLTILHCIHCWHFKFNILSEKIN